MPTNYTFAETESVKAMCDDIHNLRPQCDVLVVHFHKGLGMQHIKLAAYEQQVSYAAIEAGADWFWLNMLTLYEGWSYIEVRPFHGLGQFVPFDPDAKPTPGSPWPGGAAAEVIYRNFRSGIERNPKHGPSLLNSMFTIIAKIIIAKER